MIFNPNTKSTNLHHLEAEYARYFANQRVLIKLQTAKNYNIDPMCFTYQANCNGETCIRAKVLGQVRQFIVVTSEMALPDPYTSWIGGAQNMHAKYAHTFAGLVNWTCGIHRFLDEVVFIPPADIDSIAEPMSPPPEWKAIHVPEPTYHLPHKCNICASPALFMFNNVECSNARCHLFVQPKPIEEPVAKSNKIEVKLTDFLTWPVL